MCIIRNAKGSSSGIGCVIYNEGGIFGVTAKHVFFGLCSDDVTPRPLTPEEKNQRFSVHTRHSSSRCSISGRYKEGNNSVEEIG